MCRLERRHPADSASNALMLRINGIFSVDLECVTCVRQAVEVIKSFPEGRLALAHLRSDIRLWSPTVGVMPSGTRVDPVVCRRMPAIGWRYRQLDIGLLNQSRSGRMEMRRARHRNRNAAIPPMQESCFENRTMRWLCDCLRAERRRLTRHG